MTAQKERFVLYPPMKTPRGWFVLYQPDYKTPNVFNLHERGLFKTRPSLSKDYGARLIVSEDLRVAVQYMQLTEANTVDQDTGETYSYINSSSLINLTEMLTLSKKELSGNMINGNLTDEIARVYEEWKKSHIPLTKDGKIDREELKNRLTACIKNGKRTNMEWLIRQNNRWIKPFLPRMIQDFRHGLFERVIDKLDANYRERGGEDTEEGMIKKINLFIRIYESEGLLKPDGTTWISEDEIWDCWVAFSGSESEAKRTCSTLEAVLIPLREELKKELNFQ